MPSDKKDIVVVTGFGPFGEHQVNASWIAVQELAKRGLDDENVEIVIHEMPVLYEHVKNIVPDLWEKYNPVLMIHVGVSGMATELTLEQLSFNTGYTKPDMDGLIPDTHSCIDGCCDNVINSCINMGLVCHEVNQAGAKIKAVVSRDPGRYLCGFSYFLSLHRKSECTAFIHVPPVNSPYTATELAEGLHLSIKSMLKQVKQLKNV